jgi:hypothetical protein
LTVRDDVPELVVCVKSPEYPEAIVTLVAVDDGV